jgi:isopenicillin N synthase-like dioxygenase
MTVMPIISLSSGDADALGQQLGNSFQTYGFATVIDHGLDPALVAKAWALTKTLFAQSEAQKRAGFDAAIAGQRGYTPFKTEIAKGADFHDLKEFWHVGRDVAPDSPLAGSMLPNIWPDVPEFKETFQLLYKEMDKVGARILSSIARYLDLPAGWFDPAIADGNSILRLLHYPPIAGDAEGCIRAGAHEDINLITLLLGAEEAGLQILRPDGSWMDVSPPEGGLAVNVGDMLQRLTNDQLKSTTHRVVNPPQSQWVKPRYSIPFFLHPRPNVPLNTLPQCITGENPKKYSDCTAMEFLLERLREIGLIK